MLRAFVILLVSVSVWASPVPQERNDPNPMMNFAGQMVKSMAGKAAQSVAEGMVDQAGNVFGLAFSAGKGLQGMLSSGTQEISSQLGQMGGHEEVQDPNKYGYKYRRAQDPMVDAILRKKIQSTIKDIDEVISPLRNARAEGSGNVAIATTIFSALIGLMKNIPQLAPLIEMLRPFLSTMGINV